jgi:hypothetical protein
MLQSDGVVQVVPGRGWMRQTHHHIYIPSQPSGGTPLDARRGPSGGQNAECLVGPNLVTGVLLEWNPPLSGHAAARLADGVSEG